MTFNSLPFFALFVITYLLVKVLQTNEIKLWVLLIASYVFYSYWDVRFLLLMLLMEYVSYLAAIKIELNRKKAKKYLGSSVAFSLFILSLFKYFGFFLQQIEMLMGKNALHWRIVLPIGISFYTFQCISYVVDVYRGEIKARKKFRDVSLYISFFPQLVAGPIIRAKDFLPQIDSDLTLTGENLSEGIQIFLWGLFKKAVVADRLAVCVDAVWASPKAYSSLSIWCAAISYSLQILCDFSGYSDMAIGIARVFGFCFPLNFDLPYISKSPKEFWKRWHISLSLWLRDYLYIPLGGNRKGNIRTYLNLLVTMLLGGLWHGANWTFIIWGVVHGIALVLNRLFGKTKNDSLKSNYVSRLKNIIKIFLTNLFVLLCWILFRSESLSDAGVVIQRMFVPSRGINYVFTWSVLFFVGSVAFYFWAYKNGGHIEYKFIDSSKTIDLYCFFLLVALIMVFGYLGSNAFIYFQF
ncbi:MBOAT family O-acyltransferase [Butyrivibrio sp. VCB2006]|uniref:MBOAT family O-acyltransferase n=1 Tax=Butyrivibrio sp. VCB2006 TaxID=1280679 RepID=UPI0003F5D880|nr:MBOAT family protein [Butyrivibrio sp. VCB2006]